MKSSRLKFANPQRQDRIMKNQSELISEMLLGVPKQDYSEKYFDHLLEQYKLFLTLTDKISDRRSAANSFFLTVNTGLISAIGLANVFSADSKIPYYLFVAVGIAVIVLCYSWYRLIRSYRDLNSAKFKVIHEIEKLLPIRPYDSEWEAIGRGQNKKLYLPFTHIEIFVPWIFMALYVCLIVIGIIKRGF
jgi:hypothetical protein